MRLMHSGLAAQQRRRDLGKGRCHFLRAGPPAATQYDTGAQLGMARACHLISEVITLILGEFKSVFAIMERLRVPRSYLSNDVVRPISLDKAHLKLESVNNELSRGHFANSSRSCSDGDVLKRWRRADRLRFLAGEPERENK